MKIQRRTFLAASAAVIATPVVAAQTASIPAIDTHVHLWDMTRPQGAPFPTPGSRPGIKYYNTPKMTANVYSAEVKPEGVVGIIAVEASPWNEDNLWLLETCQAEPTFVGMIGNLKPEDPDYAAMLERYNKHPLFLGIRYGNVWRYDFIGQSKNPVFIEGLKLLAKTGKVLEIANPEVGMLQAAIRVSDAVPDLRIIVEHLVDFKPPADKAAAYAEVLKEYPKRPQFIGKLAAPPLIGPETDETRASKDRWKHLMEVFGEDRIIANNLRNYMLPSIDAFVAANFKGKTAQAEKYLWKNSTKAYRWIKRTPDQPTIT